MKRYVPGFYFIPLGAVLRGGWCHIGTMLVLCFSLPGSAFAQGKPYCVPAISYDCSINNIAIQTFRLHTLTNNNSGCNGQENSYIHYPAAGSLTTRVQRGQSYSFTLQSTPTYPQGFGIWLDYNNDADFDDAGEFIYNSDSFGVDAITGTLTILTGVQEGQRRLRVRSKFEGTFTSAESCTTADFGETEDYTITIGEGTTILWNQRYGGLENEGFTSIIKTSDGGYLAGGYSASGNSGDKSQISQGQNDYWIVKTDAKGNKLWNKSYGGPENDYLNRVIQTQDGGYLLAGSSLSGIGGDKTQTSRGERDYWLVKIDGQGQKQWDKRFGGKGSDELKKVIQLATGEYLLAGHSNSPASGDKSQGSQGGWDYWLVKVSINGVKLWDKRYGGSLDETLGGIVQVNRGGLLLGGSSASGISGEKSAFSRGGYDFWLVRTDDAGNLIWDKTYGGTGQDQVFSVGKSGKSDFFISGQSDSPAGWDKTRGPQGGIDYWFIKVTSTGEKVWDKRFGGKKDDELRASIQTIDGGYLLAGKSFSSRSGNKKQPSQGSSDYWIVKTDADGMYQWDRRYGGTGAEELKAVLQTDTGGFLLAGKSESDVSGDKTQPSRGGNDYWLVETTPETLPTTTRKAPAFAEKGVAKVELSAVTALPNPFQEQVIVRFTLPETQSVQVKIYDVQGKAIATLFQGEAKANQVYQVKWNASNQMTGMYLLQLKTPIFKNQQKLLLRK